MKRKEYIPNCIKVSTPCQRHLDGSYLHHACGEKYPHKERLPFTNSHKEKIRIALTGKKLSKQHIENLKGRIPYNKGTKGLCKGNITSFKKGEPSWNKGLPKEEHPCFGLKISEKHKLKLSESRKGKKTSVETKQKLRDARKLFFIRGGKPPNWIEDRTKLKRSDERNGPLYKEWARKVKIRDKWKCKINNENCVGRTEAHHILGWCKYPELRFDVNNGISLCKAHHPRKRSIEKRLANYFYKLLIV